MGGFCAGGFWQGGFLSKGFLSGGLCPGGFCPGGFCPDTEPAHATLKWKLGVEYLVILSHGIVQFHEGGFHFPFQTELLIGEVNPFLLLPSQFYLCLLELLYCQSCLFLFLLMLSLDSLKNK